ncbi:alpha/beta fold hydrolase [Streptomyces sp. NPDC046821]|uniref:alpha/beta fold hydrolase n=1 Tax=Streptomyces sp. NPDC046821 TaxID=3154702 RepID=UPI0033FC955D
MTTYVLIPGAGGSAWYWHLAGQELSRRGRDVVAVDLPGPDTGAGLARYADVVADAVGDRTDLVVVGQSLGAFTAPLVCVRLPVSLLVLVNGMIPKPGETAGQWWEHTGHEAARRANDVREGRDPDGEFDPVTYFLHDLSQELIDESADHMQDESDAAFAEPFPLDVWPAVPTRVIAARDDRLFPADFQRRVAQDRLGITPDEVPGGHLAALSHPKELADLLESYVRELA